jgi:hypothetical protein
MDNPNFDAFVRVLSEVVPELQFVTGFDGRSMLLQTPDAPVNLPVIPLINESNNCYANAVLTALYASGSMHFVAATKRSAFSKGFESIANRLTKKEIDNGTSCKGAVQRLRQELMEHDDTQEDASEFAVQLGNHLDLKWLGTTISEVHVNTSQSGRVHVNNKITKTSPFIPIARTYNATTLNILDLTSGQAGVEFDPRSSSEPSKSALCGLFKSVGVEIDIKGTKTATFPVHVLDIGKSDFVAFIFGRTIENIDGIRKDTIAVVSPFVVFINKKVLRLSAVVVHIGREAKSGHYVCYFRRKGMWVLSNDMLPKLKGSEEDAKLVETLQKNATIWVYSEDRGTRETSAELRMALASELFRVYEAGHAPPAWSIKVLMNEALLKKVTCYRLSNTDKDIVRRILTRRQPVNMRNHLCFDACAASTLFEQQPDGDAVFQSGYTSNASGGPKPPQIAVYTHTPKGSDTGLLVHIVHSIGLALDVKTQSDYKWLDQQADRLAAVKQHLVDMFTLVLGCATKKKLKKVALSYVGGDAFSKLDSNLVTSAEYEELFVDAIFEVFNGQDFEVVGLLGDETDLCELIAEKLKKNINPLGHVPEALTSDDVLYQNAWNPHSVVGNGNSKDISLDGFVGQNTAAGVLSLPLTNPFIKHVAIDVRR